jgi:hypothetical protein
MRTGLRLNVAVVFLVLVSAAIVFGNPRIGSATNGDSSGQSSGPGAAYNVVIPGAAPFRPPFADNSFHDHVSVERNAAERGNWRSIVYDWRREQQACLVGDTDGDLQY